MPTNVSTLDKTAPAARSVNTLSTATKPNAPSRLAVAINYYVVIIHCQYKKQKKLPRPIPPCPLKPGKDDKPKAPPGWMVIALSKPQLVYNDAGELEYGRDAMDSTSTLQRVLVWV